MIVNASFAIVCAAGATWFILRALLPTLRRLLLDKPNERSSHRQPTPRGGGVSFVLVACVASCLSVFIVSGTSFSLIILSAAPLIALPLALVGLLDDRYNLPASWRFSVQLATSVLVTLLSPLVFPSVGQLPLLALLIIAVTAVINFINFMDGMDGLVSGCMLVAITSAGIHLAAPWPVWALIGALLGFLLWNWSPAKVFMGDAGSTFLGAVFALLVLQASSWFEAFALLLVATPLLGDACICVPRRLIAGQQVFQAHRLHLFQRLHQAGWSHARVSTFYISATALLAISFHCGGLILLLPLVVVELFIGIWLDQHLAFPFVAASRH